ncbi:organic solute transporter subunit alpha isoform X2 [Eurytemora carolleeae]|uniref:organic solute transporter subunit alpha isoform X2 n=1 Tax=Eurytemora carolleeae TaxID=1294199 RepID=UPI000C7677FB|nr:organic solute transporter subunit alpha isoform X2 [Eurytemora carolleeae]XP_023340955.1 organic solute transporter subunit alpha isoform X2 [Eurytemora carolleeae]|eukprot:XP_023340954.1 organic solute transporter subunit alpha-like isoform X2 [Eurytemora affinis]
MINISFKLNQKLCNLLVSTLWVSSIYLVISVFNMVGIVLPQANDFLWFAYKIFVGISMGHFVDLTLTWYGGETAMLEHVGEETSLNFRKPPCCCCLILPTNARLTKNKIRFLRGSVYQIPYTESLSLLILVSLEMAGYVTEGSLTLASPDIYITVLISLSSFCGIWGLFMFFNITQQFNLLSNFNYAKKSGLMKITIIIINFQSMIIDVCNRFGLITCIPGALSPSGVANLIKAVCVLIESFLLGTMAFFVYKDEGTYM